MCTSPHVTSFAYNSGLVTVLQAYISSQPLLCFASQYSCLLISAGEPGNFKKIQASMVSARKVFRIMRVSTSFQVHPCYQDLQLVCRSLGAFRLIMWKFIVFGRIWDALIVCESFLKMYG